MTTHICTTGTSIAGGPLREGTFDEYSHYVKQRLGELRKQPHEQFLASASAEVNSLNRLGIKDGDRVCLLCTDTEDGELCAHSVAEVVEKDIGAQVEVSRVSGLQVTNAREFAREGIPNLFDTVNQITGANARYGDYRLNVTGGFKSVVPYLTLYGLINRLPVDYLFESPESVPLTLPSAPVNFDYGLFSRAERALRALREEGAMPRERFFELIDDLPAHDRDLFEPLLEEDGDYVAPGAFLMLLYDQGDSNQSKVYLSPSARAAWDSASANSRASLGGMLERSRNALWRKANSHGFARTDLAVFKPGNCPWRMAAILQPGKTCVCELYASHDDYERDLPGRNQADYDLSAFSEWFLPDDVEVTSEEHEFQALRAQGERNRNELAQAREQINAQRRTLDETRAERSAAQNEVGTLQSQNNQLRSANDSLNARNKALEHQYEQLEAASSRRTWWQRLLGW